jgi:hypothetical protein
VRRGRHRGARRAVLVSMTVDDRATVASGNVASAGVSAAVVGGARRTTHRTSGAARRALSLCGCGRERDPGRGEKEHEHDRRYEPAALSPPLFPLSHPATPKRAAMLPEQGVAVQRTSRILDASIA